VRLVASAINGVGFPTMCKTVIRQIVDDPTVPGNVEFPATSIRHPNRKGYHGPPE